MAARRHFTVSDLTLLIKQTLEEGFPDVTLEGEISNFKIHTSGHCYFTLKDERSQIQAVMWRSRVAGLAFTPDAGMKVIARGAVTVYPVRGVYQIDVLSLRPAGEGELQAAFERLKRKLFEEGLFDEARKKPLPEFPETVGLVTSATGAAITDILNVFSRRAPYLRLILAPVSVQGRGAAEEIAGALRWFSDNRAADLLIVGRGGGSIEDLWAFNEEVTARAIAACPIPVISAVGHEIDVTISDFVADKRAPTPSAAAEIAAPSRAELVETLENYYYTATSSVERRLEGHRERLRGHLRSYSFRLPADLVRQRSQRLDDLRTAMVRAAGRRIELLRRAAEGTGKRLENLDPARVLARGYAVVERDGRAVGSAGRIASGDELTIRFHDGSIGARSTGPAPSRRTEDSDATKA